MAGESLGGRRRRLADWAIPRPVVRLSLVVSAALLAPLVAAFVMFGATAALALGMGYTVCLTPALKLRTRYALALSVPAAMTGVVASALQGSALPAACFVALVCLLAAPANVVQDKLVAGIPTAAAAFVALPGTLEPLQVGGWMLVGGVIAVAVAIRLRQPEPLEGVEPLTAWLHAASMAAVVGAVVFAVIWFDVPHGYWIALTLTVVLRPYGAETRSVARQRVAGTVVGALLGLLLALVLPRWAVLVALGVLMVLMVAYAILGDYSRQITFMTPAVVLLGSSSAGAFLVAADRVLATLLGALLAAGVALALARFERRRRQAIPVAAPDRS